MFQNIQAVQSVLSVDTDRHLPPDDKYLLTVTNI